jgi:hypothetical protein
MLYDYMGQVAGIQFGINNTNVSVSVANGYPLFPGTNVKSPPYFTNMAEEGIWYVTVHLTDPGTLCANGVKRADDDTGDRLWVRTNEAETNAPENFDPLPLKRSDMLTGRAATEGWAAGGCMLKDQRSIGMGQHYWRYSPPMGPVNDAYSFFVAYDHNGDITLMGIQMSSATRMACPLPAEQSINSGSCSSIQSSP